MKAIPAIPGNKYTILTLSPKATLRRKEVVIVSTLKVPELRPSPNESKAVRYCIGTHTLAHDGECRDLDIDILGALVIPGWNQFTNPSAVHHALSLEAIRKILDANLNPHCERYELLASRHDLPDSADRLANPDNASKTNDFPQPGRSPWS